MFESDLLLCQKITAAIVLCVFCIGRFGWSRIKGKRERKNVSSDVVSVRFTIQLFASGIIPGLLILNIFDISKLTMITHSSNVGLYLIGLIASLLGITLMFFTRFHRQKDWGFMGDNAGEVLFTKGIYGVTRHPYYVGAILVGLGIYLILNSWFILIMLPIILFVNKVIKKEDQYLFEKFKDEWKNYKNKVGIIPFV